MTQARGGSPDGACKTHLPRMKPQLLLLLALCLLSPPEADGRKGKKKSAAGKRRQASSAEPQAAQPSLGAARDSPPKGWVKEWSHPFKDLPPSDRFPLTAVVDGALPEPLLERLHGEAGRFWKSHRAATFANDKKATVWLAKADSDGRAPRCFIEEAVAALASLIDVTAFGLSPDVKLAGGEWWVQQMKDTESIGFHYDKDEAMASDHWQMSYPVLSTITYLDDIGAPTLILNQTTPHGNGEDPLIPEYGTLVYPKRGRHVIFRGDLQHGTVGSLTKEKDPDRQRLTLLVNWWTYAPLKPNTDEMSDKLAQDYGLNYPDEVKSWMGERTEVTMKGGRVIQKISGCELWRSPSQSLGEGETEAAGDIAHLYRCQRKQTPSTFYPPQEEDSSSAEDTSLYGIKSIDDAQNAHQTAVTEQLASTPAALERLTKVLLPPGEGLFFETPPLAQVESHAVYQFHWNASQVFGHVAELEPTNELLWSVLRMDARPKVVVFSPPEDLPRVKSFVLPLARVWTDRLKFVLADGSNSGWAATLGTFGVDAALAKREAVAVVTDTQGAGSHKAACAESGDELNAASLQRFAQEQIGAVRERRRHAEL